MGMTHGKIHWHYRLCSARGAMAESTVCSGPFDLMSQSWPYLTASGTLDSVLGSKAEKKLLMQRPSRMWNRFRAVRKRVKRCERATKPADRRKSAKPALPRGQCFIHHFHERHRPIRRQTQRKAGDSLAGRPIELVPGNKTTAVSPRECAQKEPEEFAAHNPTKNTCPHWDPTNLTIPNRDPTKIEQGSRLASSPLSEVRCG
ncbi:hypothetical protein B0H11DRAFT_2194913 [Mycena galericulata]|nr:hypothetical protein B0H11DRAFT_2194913 [Mycena galericulata]